MTQHRAFYRIVFPIRERPRLTIGNRTFDVIDISEGGARLACTDQPPHSTEFPAAANVAFQGGATVDSMATLLREDDGAVVVRFTDNLPYAAIMAEQRRLLAVYPPEALRRS